MARRSPAVDASPDEAPEPELIRPTLDQIETAKRLVAGELTMASPMDEHLIHIALLLALNLDLVMGESAAD